MNTTAVVNNPLLHLPAEKMQSRSVWYGPNLVTILACSSETGGTFGLVKTKLRKGFEPPLHMHSREDESNIILEGEVLYTIGDTQVHARAGDFVYLPKNVPHTFSLLSDTACTLMLMTPGGFEEMFVRCGCPAPAMELPTLAGPPPKEFFDTLNQVNAELGVTIFPAFL